MSSLGTNERERGRRPAAPGRRGLGRHSIAALRAAMAGLYALLHPLKAFAARRTRAADFGALAAEMGMVVGASHHEVKRSLTDLGTIEHQRHMLGIGMLAAHLQTVCHGHRQAADAAVMPGVDTRLHLRAHPMGHTAFLSSSSPRLDEYAPAAPNPLADTRRAMAASNRRGADTTNGLGAEPLTLTRCQTLHERALVGAA